MAEPDLREVFARVARHVNTHGGPTIGRDSVIAELGIDSLALMQIVGDLETELGVMIPDEDLVELVTVGDLCERIGKRL